MKVSALIFLCIVGVTVAVAIPVQPEYGAESQLTLADLENEQRELNFVDGATDDNQNVAREKRFILKKLVLAKLAHLGLGYGHFNLLKVKCLPLFTHQTLSYSPSSYTN